MCFPQPHSVHLLTRLQSGTIQSVSTTVDGKRSIHFSFGYYIFDGNVTDDNKTLTLTMRNPGGSVSQPFSLDAMHINPTDIRSVTVYTGRLDWLSYAKDEMTMLVVPYGIAEGMFFGLYHQWTVDANGVEKANVRVNGVFQDVVYGADGTVTASFKAEYYTYSFTFNGKEGSFVLSNPSGDKSGDNKFALAYSL